MFSEVQQKKPVKFLIHILKHYTNIIRYKLQLFSRVTFKIPMSVINCI